MIWTELLVAVAVALFGAAIAGTDEEPTPPVGWFFVIFMAELVGVVIAHIR